MAVVGPGIDIFCQSKGCDILGQRCAKPAWKHSVSTDAQEGSSMGPQTFERENNTRYSRGVV
jgi:hypothetical protein